MYTLMWSIQRWNAKEYFGYVRHYTGAMAPMHGAITTSPHVAKKNRKDSFLFYFRTLVFRPFQTALVG